jgi:UDP-N-acetylmuramoyl-tripeptide--D-alanyl-D-alanine ligase
VVVVDDAYNANPESMKASLEAFAEILGDPARPQRSRIAVLGSMLELGDDASILHREIGACAARTNLTHLLVVKGDEGRMLAEGALDSGFAGEIRLVEDAEEAGHRTVELAQPGDVVLVKGSRGIGLEVVVDMLARRQENNG